MEIRGDARLRIWFQFLMAIIAFILLGQPFARPDSLTHRSIYLAIMVGFFGVIFVVAYAIWPRESDRSLHVRRFVVVALLFALVSYATWEPWLSRFPRSERISNGIVIAAGGFAAPLILLIIYIILSRNKQ